MMMHQWKPMFSIMRSGYPGGVWHGPQDDTHPAGVLGLASDGGEVWGKLRARLLETPTGNSGVPPLTQSFKRGC